VHRVYAFNRAVKLGKIRFNPIAAVDLRKMRTNCRASLSLLSRSLNL